MLLIGTLSPAQPDGWWPQLVEDGSAPGRHVQLMQAPEDAPWDDYQVIARCNPVLRVSASQRRTALRQRDEARRNPRLRPAFEAWRLNRLVEVTRESLLRVQDYKAMVAREVPDRSGRPVLGIDAGAVSSWTAAALVWPNGRVEAVALVGGAKSLAKERAVMGGPRAIPSASRLPGP